MKARSANFCEFSFLCFLFMLLISQSSLAQFQGKIFTTPEERVYLDALRRDFLKKSQEQGFDIDQAGAPPLPDTAAEQTENTAPIEYSLGGILTRSDGSRTVWLNNQPIAESNLPSNMRLVADGPVVVLRVAIGTSTFRIKPGQTLNASTGEIQEAYQRAPTPAAATPSTATDTETIVPSSQLLPDRNTESPQPETPAPEASGEVDTREAP